MLRKYPQLRGKVDVLVEQEIKSGFDALYDIIENLAQKANVDLSINTPSSPSATNTKATSANTKSAQNGGVGLNNDVFSQPLLNQGQVLQTQLQNIVPKSTLTSTLSQTVGVFAVGGKISITTLDGKSIEILTP